MEVRFFAADHALLLQVGQDAGEPQGKPALGREEEFGAFGQLGLVDLQDDVHPEVRRILHLKGDVLEHSVHGAVLRQAGVYGLVKIGVALGVGLHHDPGFAFQVVIKRAGGNPCGTADVLDLHIVEALFPDQLHGHSQKLLLCLFGLLFPAGLCRGVALFCH